MLWTSWRQLRCQWQRLATTIKVADAQKRGSGDKRVNVTLSRVHQGETNRQTTNEKHRGTNHSAAAVEHHA